MDSNIQQIIEKNELNILLREEDFHIIAQITKLLRKKGLKWDDIFEIVLNFEQNTRIESKKERSERIILAYIDAKGGEYRSELTTTLHKVNVPKRPNASSTGIANELALEFGMTSLGVQKILKKAGVWQSSRKSKDKKETDKKEDEQKKED